MREDSDDRLATLLVDLVRLRQLLPPEDFADLLGAVSLEVETGMEMVIENQYRSMRHGNVIAFPCQQR